MESWYVDINAGSKKKAEEELMYLFTRIGPNNEVKEILLRINVLT